MLGYGIITPSIPIFAKLLNASETEIGLAFSAYPVAFILVVLPFGKLVDRIGRNHIVISLGMFLLFASSMLLSVAHSFFILSMARAFQGMASAISWVAAQPLAAQCTPEDGKGGGMQLSLISTSYGLGMIMGPILGSLNPFELPFLICGLIALTLSLISFFAVKTSSKASEKVEGTVKSLLKKRGIMLGCLVILYAYLCIGMLELLFPLYMDSLSFSKSDIGILFGVLAIILTISQPFIGKWIEKSGLSRPMYSALAINAIAMLIIVKVSGFMLWLPVVAAFGFSLGALVTTSMSLIAASSRKGEQGLAYGLWNLSFSIGYLIGPAASGAIADYSGMFTSFLIGALITIPIIILAVKYYQISELNP